MSSRFRDFFVYAVVILAVVLSCFFLQLFVTKTNVRVIEGDFSSYLSGKNESVVIYGTSWCQYCEATRDFFLKNKIAFVDLDIEKSPVAFKEYTSLGGGGVPLILIGNRKIQGYSESTIKQSVELLKVKK